MTDSQHDSVMFILIALVGGAVLGAIVTLAGCGGAEFQKLADVKPDSATIPEIFAPLVEIDAERRVIRDAHSVMQDAYDASPVNTPDASLVEEDAKVDAISNSCDVDACSTHCPGNNLPCCTAAGVCGCHDFGPVCLIP